MITLFIGGICFEEVFGLGFFVFLLFCGEKNSQIL